MLDNDRTEPAAHYSQSIIQGLCCPDISSVCVFVCSRWVNALGMAAVQGIDVVLRHSFFDYGYTHLVDQNFNPLPVSPIIAFHRQGLDSSGSDPSSPVLLRTFSPPLYLPRWHLSLFSRGSY